VDQDQSRKPDQICKGRWGRGLKGFFLPKDANLPIDALLVVLPEQLSTPTAMALFQGPACADLQFSRSPRARCRDVQERSSVRVSRGGAKERMGPEKLAQLAPKLQARNTSHNRRAVGMPGNSRPALPRVATAVGSISVSPERIDLG